ncbi:hypothetical protein BDP55DRAFT_627003 [Colletotrichum godetiae]|uniref:Uncharacterized protein n=1 Tax=Colletotrichum godetiae TaxID=1209918 RepID=A0AAJ0AVU6_9PEZI|nr:uncharacterized protein BDP55DRAFT_627003 [Colletotrichum godetiae]KAK1691326.1 hypothetical protein BDP55DRAFT_627003 [Colletotrichum godetiae]
MPRAPNPEPDGTIKPRIPRLLSNSSTSWPRAHLTTVPRSAWGDRSFVGSCWRALGRFLVWRGGRTTLYRATSALAPTNAPLGIKVEVSVEQIKGKPARWKIGEDAPLTPDQAIRSRIQPAQQQQQQQQQQQHQPTHVCDLRPAACPGLFGTLVPASTHGSTLAFRTIQGPREHGWTFLTFRVRPCPPASTAPGYLKHPNANRSGAIHPSGTVTTPSKSNHC